MNEGIKAASRNGVHVICLGSSCQLCAVEVTRFKSLAPDGLEKWFHLVKVVFFHVYDIKARTISLPIKNGVCFTCLEMLRSGSYRDSQFEIEAVDSIDLAGPAHAIVAEPVQFTSTANKKRTGNVRLPPPKKAKGKGKATTNVAAVITHDELFKTKDALFRKYISEYANSSPLSCGDDYHSVHLDDFKKSAQECQVRQRSRAAIFWVLQ